jgi:fructokinase
MLRIGVDLGGTKIEVIAVDGSNAVRSRRRSPTPRHDYAATLEVIVALVAEVEAEAGGRGSVGIGIPGAISPATGLAKNANSTWLNGKPLHRDFEHRLGRPVRLANDANCFALSEATDGAGAGARVVFGAIVGTGTGGGIVVDGRVLTGANGIGGEWGHNPLPWPEASETPGPECYCRRRGCIELFLSGPGLSRDHRDQTGEDLAAEDIAARAAAGDGRCEDTLRRYESRMARGLASIINVVDPDVIVLGGGMSNVTRLYTSVPNRWGEWVFSDRVDTRLVPPRHGPASGARGAAWLWSLQEAEALALG